MPEKTAQIPVPVSLRDAIKEAKGDSTYQDFLAELLALKESTDDAYEKFDAAVAEAEADVPVVTDIFGKSEAIDAVVTALTDVRVQELCRCNPGKAYVERQAMLLLGLPDPAAPVEPEQGTRPHDHVAAEDDQVTPQRATFPAPNRMDPIPYVGHDPVEAEVADQVLGPEVDDEAGFEGEHGTVGEIPHVNEGVERDA